jgi:UDPglucose--hexose-1-phosphate uridylyltransferase
MSSWLFELRRDAITGWWVATVVDRAVQRERFARAAVPVDDGGDCQNCRAASGRVQRRLLRGAAFRVVGTEDEARRGSPPGASRRGGAAGAGGEREADPVGSWETIIAPAGEHRPLHAVGSALIVDLLDACREAVASARVAGRTAYLQVVQNWGAQAGARTNHLCLDLYDLPQIPHRVAEELGGAARYLIREGECAFCRLIREEARHGERLVWADDHSVAFAPYASRSPFEVWIVPRRHRADFGSAQPDDLRSSAEALRQVLGRLAILDGPPYNLVLHTAPLREDVETTYHWHWEVHPRLREIAGLELGSGLPVNPVAPEDAVEELLARRQEAIVGGSDG